MSLGWDSGYLLWGWLGRILLSPGCAPVRPQGAAWGGPVVRAPGHCPHHSWAGCGGSGSRLGPSQRSPVILCLGAVWPELRAAWGPAAVSRLLLLPPIPGPAECSSGLVGEGAAPTPQAPPPPWCPIPRQNAGLAQALVTVNLSLAWAPCLLRFQESGEPSLPAPRPPE